MAGHLVEVSKIIVATSYGIAIWEKINDVGGSCCGYSALVQVCRLFSKRGSKVLKSQVQSPLEVTFLI